MLPLTEEINVRHFDYFGGDKGRDHCADNKEITLKPKLNLVKKKKTKIKYLFNFVYKKPEKVKLMRTHVSHSIMILTRRSHRSEKTLVPCNIDEHKQN